jgi:hypothetical protein
MPASGTRLGQNGRKSNEIIAIPKILNILTIKAPIVTIDTIRCQRDIAQKILERKGRPRSAAEEQPRIVA